jgi:predicted ATPase
MISRIEVLNYRCLKRVDQALGRFHVLVGPNASGKSTFLDALAFLGRLVCDGLDAALSERTSNFWDLVWGRGQSDDHFEMAVEAPIPGLDQMAILSSVFDTVRYEVSVGLASETKKVELLSEQILLGRIGRSASAETAPRDSVSENSSGWMPLVSDYRAGKGGRMVAVVPETSLVGTEHPLKSLLFPHQRRYSVLLALEESPFPASAWLSEIIQMAREPISLDVGEIKRPCPPGTGLYFRGTGANLAQIVGEMVRYDQQTGQFREWLGHVRTALPNVQSLRVIERPEDRHLYLGVIYSNGLEVPSWTLSDGTLRLLALTVIPYYSSSGGLWLVEEPENGIHPLNLETVMQSLKSLYSGQALVTTHSPAVLALAETKEILVFESSQAEGARIVRGDRHPRLRDWKGEPDLSVLFASGVLG